MRKKINKIFSVGLFGSLVLSLYFLAAGSAGAQASGCQVELDGLTANPTTVSTVQTKIVLTTHVTSTGDGCDGYTVRFSVQGDETTEGVESNNISGPVDNKLFTANTSLENISSTDQGVFQVEVRDNNNQVVSGTLETSPAVNLSAQAPGGGGNPPSGGSNPATSTASSGGGNISFSNPIGASNLPQFIIQATKILLLLVGMIVVVVIIYGGFVLVTSQGNPDGIKRGKATITWAIVGLVVALLAFSIVAILQNLLKTGGTSSTSTSTSQSANPPNIPTIQYPTPPVNPAGVPGQFPPQTDTTPPPPPGT